MRTVRSPVGRQLLAAAMVFVCIALTLTTAACRTSTKASTTSVPTPVSSSPSSTGTSSAVTSSTENSAKIAVDLGPADQINLHEAWLQIAKARSFDATTARAWDVTLDWRAMLLATQASNRRFEAPSPPPAPDTSRASG